MARPRVCLHDVPCPECGSNWMPKDGTSKDRQVYHCGDCGRRTIHDAAYQRPGAADKERVLAMYSEGQFAECHRAHLWRQCPGGQQVGLKGGRAALSRMRRRGAKRTAGVAGTPAAVAELDGSRWADFELGDRSEATFLRLYERLPEAEL